jgi:hypothetical protein
MTSNMISNEKHLPIEVKDKANNSELISNSMSSDQTNDKTSQKSNVAQQTDNNQPSSAVNQAK